MPTKLLSHQVVGGMTSFCLQQMTANCQVQVEFSEGLPYAVSHELLSRMVRGRWVLKICLLGRHHRAGRWSSRIGFTLFTSWMLDIWLLVVGLESLMAECAFFVKACSKLMMARATSWASCRLLGCGLEDWNRAFSICPSVGKPVTCSRASQVLPSRYGYGKHTSARWCNTSIRRTVLHTVAFVSYTLYTSGVHPG